MDTVKRSNEVDIIRMVALIGICIVNISFMALPIETQFFPPETLPDKIAAFFVETFFQLKFFILFSFVFGWGMAIQRRSAKSKGKSFFRHYFGRIAGLAFIGINHAIFVFTGDILVLYAFLGTILWLIKDYSPRSLLKIALWMLPLSMVCLTILALSIDTMMTKNSVLLTTQNGDFGGGYFAATEARISSWFMTFVFLLFLQGPLAFSAFAVGLAVAKSDFFHEDSEDFKFIRQKLPLLLVIALPLNILYAAVIGGIVPESYEVLILLGFVLIAIGAPALSTIYLYFFVLLSRRFKMPYLLVLSGRNSLSTYVVQGILTGFVFGAYGLGLFNTLGFAELLPISLVIAFGAMLGVGIYVKIFERGPLETLLRFFSR